jgi:hypothetical protein
MEIGESSNRRLGVVNAVIGKLTRVLPPGQAVEVPVNEISGNCRHSRTAMVDISEYGTRLSGQAIKQFMLQQP